MDLKIDIDKDAVERALVDAVLKSAIGEEVQKAVDKVLKSKDSNQWDSKTLIEAAVDRAVRQQLEFVISDALTPKRDVIRAAVQDKLTDDFIREWVSTCWKNIDQWIKAS